MKSIIIYFSGTGNTHFVASKIVELRSDKEMITLMPYEQYSPERVEEADRVYIGFPVYGLTLPHLLQEPFFKSISGKEVYIFSTMAYSAGVALAKSVELARVNGATVIGARTVVMPGSDGLGFMKEDSPQVSAMCERDFESIPEMRLIEEDLVAIDNGDTSYRTSDFSHLSSVAKGALSIGAAVMKPMEKWLSKKLNANSGCTGCTLCEQICPTHNITVTGKSVTFGETCTLCVRCVHHCPSKAINIGKMTVGKFKYPGPGEKRFRPMTLVKR